MTPNPLRDARDRRLPRVPDPCALVVFGVTGDLARKKLIPAVYDLGNRGLLPPGFVLLGFARRDWDHGDFEQLARAAAKDHSRTEFRDDVWRRIADSVHFVPGSFDDDNAFDQLDETLVHLETTHGISGNAAFYLSIPPVAFPQVLKQLDRTRMADNRERGGWRRVVVEKPFGHDLASSRELNHLVDSVFTPEDVFRIDHYLGKETVQNLLALRFANTLFEPVWNSNYVDSVQITMAEDVGIEGRAAFYDSAGAARDVLQNHLLQLLALTAMEEPVSFDSESLRIEKRKVLRAISIPDDLAAYTARGQYEQGWLAGERVRGYLEEEGIPAGSTTETYAAVRLGVETRRWAGVPFYLRTGKRLPRRVTEIAVIFKRAPHLPFAKTDTEELGHNQLVVRVQPDEGITLRFGSKVPGSAMEVREVSMDFLYGASFTESSPEAYERLLLDVLLGDRTLFPDHNEVEASWQVVDPLEDYWATTVPDRYRAGEWGPRSADEVLAREGRTLEAAMTTTLWDTNGGDISKALSAERRAGGGVASGLALTFVAIADEKNVGEAERAATVAAQAHPCRLLVVIRRQLETTDRLDAEVQVGGRLGPIEAVVMRMYGRLTLHAESVVLPLLASDAPVVTWWHGAPPEQIATDPLGVLAERRITDCALAADPLAALQGRAKDFAPGDTDLAWTRATPWRSLLASAFDAASATPLRAHVAAEEGNATAALMAGWLASRLGVQVDLTASKGPGITEVGIQLDDEGDEQALCISRPDGRLATFSRTGQPDRELPLLRRELGDLLAEELRRLEVDEVYGEALSQWTGEGDLDARPPRRTFVWRDPALATG